MTGRPRSVALVAASLVLCGVLSVLVGVVATAVGGCCGSPEPASSAPTFSGLAVGVAAGIGGVMLWHGRVSRWLVLAPTLVVPLACIAASPSSSDLGLIVPFAVVGWLVLAWFVSRGRGAAWLAAEPDGL